MFSNVTILIPTYNRSNYLKRILEYYKDISFPIVIADSSLSPIEIDDRFKNVIYYHYPEMSMIEKISFTLNLIKTEYVLLCADDDFIVPESIIKAQIFLDKNLDYASVQGTYVSFDYNKLAKPDFSPYYLNAAKYKVSENEIYERLHSLTSQYMHLQYSLHRLNVLKRAFNDGARYNIKNYCLLELSTAYYSLIYGKHLVLPIFWGARESARRETVSFGSVTDDMDVIMNDDKYVKEYKGFLEMIVKYCNEEGKEKETISIDQIISTLKKYVDKRELLIKFGSESPDYYTRTITDKIGSRLSKYLLYFLSSSLKEIAYKSFYGKYFTLNYHNEFRKGYKVKSFPFFNREGKRQLKKIQDCIVNYPV